MTTGTDTRLSWNCFARCALVCGLLASTTGCVVIVRNLEISRIEPAQLATIIAVPDSHQTGGAKRAVKLQYEDGTSILFRGRVALADDTLAGNALRAAPDALGRPVAVSRVPVKGISGAVIFRERTNAGASVAASALGTAAILGALAFIAVGFADSFDRAIAETLGCALGSFGYATCSLTPARMLAPLPHGSRFRGGATRSPAGGLRSPAEPPRGTRR